MNYMMGEGPREGARSVASSLFLDQNEVRGVKKNYFEGRPPSFLGVWMSGLYLLEDPNIRPCYSLRESCPSEESREVTHEQHAKGDARGLVVGRGVGDLAACLRIFHCSRQEW